MPKYLYEVSYTADGIKGMLEKGAGSRVAAAQEAASSVGASLESFYFAFGHTDAYVIIDAPDNTAAAAIALAVSASGAVTARTVVLMTPDEADAASKTKVAFRPPGR